MYTIQRHKAIKYIFSTIHYDPVSIQYEYGIPKIIYTGGLYGAKDTSQYYKPIKYNQTIYLEHNYSYNGVNICDVLVNIFRIYGIHSWYYKATNIMYFSNIEGDLVFSLRRTFPDRSSPILFSIKKADSLDCFDVTVHSTYGTEELGLLLFLVDPLEAISKLHRKPRNSSIQYFFEYYRNTIIKQNKDLIIKYLLIGYLPTVVPDIINIIVDNIIYLLLIL